MRSFLVSRRLAVVLAILSLLGVAAGSALGQSGSRTLTVTIPFEPPHHPGFNTLRAEGASAWIDWHTTQIIVVFLQGLFPHDHIEAG